MDSYWLVLGALAVWRLTHLLQAEDGPADIIVRLRRRAGNGLWAQLLDCFYCLSLWIALPVACWIGRSYGEKALLWLALSAAAILLERTTGQQARLSETHYFEDEEDNDGVLWKPPGRGGKGR